MDEVYFNYTLSNTVVDETAIKINFLYELKNISENCFVVRPYIEKGKVEIKSDDLWFTENALWTELPNLKAELYIKIVNIPVEGANLRFEVLDMCSGKKFTTPSQTVWSKNVIDSKYKDPSIKNHISSNPTKNLEHEENFYNMFLVLKIFAVVFLVSLIFLSVVKYTNEKK